MPQFQYTVDTEPQKTSSLLMTANEILSKAGLDPAQYYLVEVDGRQRRSYQDDPDTEIHMHEGITFVSVSRGPTTVS
jgi:hypothetical protein